MKFPEALERALAGAVDEGNWRSELDELHGHYGSWSKTAAALGVHRRTLERWRHGYISRGRRVTVQPATPVGKIKATLGRDRAAAVAGVNWKQMRAKGTINFGFDSAYDEDADPAELAAEGKYERTETMYLGLYMSGETTAGLAAAYVSGDGRRVQRAIDNYLSSEYMAGMGGVRIKDVDWLEF